MMNQSRWGLWPSQIHAAQDPPRGSSNTVAAAATEKCIRRTSTLIETQDLTASQFAFMAGISVKRSRYHSDQDTDDDNDDVFAEKSATGLTPPRRSRSMMPYGRHDFDHLSSDEDDLSDSDQEDMDEPVDSLVDGLAPPPLVATSSALRSSMLTTASSSSGSTSPSPPTTRHDCPRPLAMPARPFSILDDRFWKPQSLDPAKKSPSLYDHVSHFSLVDASETWHSLGSVRVIQRGRFKITLGDEPSSPLHDASATCHVLEWHRRQVH
ncbi:hypothetical protein DM01DRAFT_1387201 [Hesseltinella vesiculosa]|uniref:Uncharacterized protein n=1 Tax=Hesseltinella vesiculosa TaxID=101127 RepID=A0A1X2G3W8_9FUNG|nr:hypothetical protein DM01DRAFT_1387201 [Hesseltinella vesiculosa]